MRRLASQGSLLIFAVAGVLAAGSAGAEGGGSAANVSQGQAWDDIKRLPDWSGIWEPVSYRKHMFGHGVAPLNNYDEVPWTPAAAKKFSELHAIAVAKKSFPTRLDRCINLGFPRAMDGPSVSTQFLFTPGQVTLIASSFLRIIHTDGREHLDDTVTYQGSSLGHWEAGGVLKVDTVALDPTNELVMGMLIGSRARVGERIYMQDQDTLVDEVVVEAPEVLTRPWTFQVVYQRSKFPFRPYECGRGLRSLNSATGELQFDLTPPPEE